MHTLTLLILLITDTMLTEIYSCILPFSLTKLLFNWPLDVCLPPLPWPETDYIKFKESTIDIKQ